MIPAATKLFLHCLVAGGLLTLGGFVLPPAATAADEPAQGRFLVATRELHGSGFAESVVLLMQHDELGTMGLVINRPSDIRLEEMLPELSEAGSFDGPLYIGGPVAGYAVILLVRSAEALEDAQHIFGDVYASGSRELLTKILRSGEASSRIRIYAGHAGWSQGQLDGEIARGSWHIVPGDESKIFSDEPANVWPELAPPPRPIVVQLN